MSKARADLGFADALDEFDPAEWNPKPVRNAHERPPKAETRKAAAAAGFRSREPQPVAVPERVGERATETVAKRLVEEAAPRRRRTGRNAQFNLKARPETIAAFCAIADRQGWGLGETLEHAVAALDAAYPSAQ